MSGLSKLETKLDDKVQELWRPDQTAEFYGIINYSVMGLIQLEKGIVDEPDLDSNEIVNLYDKNIIYIHMLCGEST